MVGGRHRIPCIPVRIVLHVGQVRFLSLPWGWLVAIVFLPVVGGSEVEMLLGSSERGVWVEWEGRVIASMPRVLDGVLVVVGSGERRGCEVVDAAFDELFDVASVALLDVAVQRYDVGAERRHCVEER